MSGRPAEAEEYRAAASAASAFIQKTFWDENAGLYHPAVPPEPKALPYDFMWANGVQFSALVGAARREPDTYRPVLDRFFRSLDRYWDRWGEIPGYDAYFSSRTTDDKYYDDNEWMVLTFVEAYELTKERRYLDRAEAALKFSLSGWDEVLGGGIYWRPDRKSKNTCSNGPGAAAALAVARHRNAKENIAWARKIVTWTNEHLQAPEGTFWDSVHMDGRIDRTKFTYNTALMLRSNLNLYRHTKEEPFLTEAKRLAQASVKEFVHPETGAFRDDGLFSNLLVEAFLDLHRETREPYLLEQARKNGDFAMKQLRDPADGGYWRRWRMLPQRNEPRKLLMANASVARMLWLLAET
jgi:predicted alpha-1,6-mannanase (GH76 family)